MLLRLRHNLARCRCFRASFLLVAALLLCDSRLVRADSRSVRSMLLGEQLFSPGEMLLLQQDNENIKKSPKSKAMDPRPFVEELQQPSFTSDWLVHEAENGNQDEVSSSSSSNNLRPNCSQCLLREEARLARIERVKSDLLNKLGLKKPPNGTIKSVPPMLPHLRGMLSRWGVNANSMLAGDAPHMAREDVRPEEEAALVEQIYVISQKPTQSVGLQDVGDGSFFFNTSPETMSSSVKSAQLHFFVKPSMPGTGPGTLKLAIYRVDSRDGKKSLVGVREFKRYGRVNGHWDRIDLTQVVRLWFSKPELNFGIVISTINSNVTMTYPAPITVADADKYTTYLNMAVKDTKASRTKRELSKSDCAERDNESRCCRYPLVIDFASFGWDWVIAPKKYKAYYCAGECPFKHLQRYMHTHLVQQVTSGPVMGPCCYPTQMAPILMVYFNENKEVLVSKIPGMVVTRCGCA